MKVLLVSTNDTGGAAKACIRLHLGLLAENVESALLVKQKKDYSIPHSHYFPQPARIPTIEEIVSNKVTNFLKEHSIIKRSKEELETRSQQEFLQQRPKGLEAFSFPFSKTDITLNVHYQEADIIHLHWTAGFLDYPSFFLKNTKPVIWTLHDMSAFSGGEHYDERFSGMDVDGKPKPRVYTEFEQHTAVKYLAIKQKALQKVKPIPIVAPTHWLKEKSEESVLFNKFRHHVIPYGLPTDIFKPLDKQFCRQVLSIPSDKNVLLFVADDVSNHRKGYIYLQRALQTMNERDDHNLFLCSVGRESGLSVSDNIRELGGIQDERLMAMAYSAADAFVLPSLEDNLPNTMLESLACGTPVIAFPTGGIVETVKHEVNGLLCDEISVGGLVQAIGKFFSGTYLFNSSEIAMESALRFNLKRQAKEYLGLYNAIMN